jgi:hypothetical protein
MEGPLGSETRMRERALGTAETEAVLSIVGRLVE